jgi:3-dehydroquinate synthase
MHTGFIIIGGGVALNLAGFAVASLRRGCHPIVLVPTTVMAVADVAVGSKTGVNAITSSRQELKNYIGTYVNPTAVVLDDQYIKTLPARERVRGLSECLKHGILQDSVLYKNALAEITSGGQNHNTCFELARTTMRLKSRVLAADPWEQDYGRILLYGHLHAHSFERASAFKLPHGDAVLLGLLVELRLGGSIAIAQEIELALKSSGIGKEIIPFINGNDELKRAYNHDNYSDISSASVVIVPYIGCFDQPFKAGKMEAKRVVWADILVAIEGVRNAFI